MVSHKTGYVCRLPCDNRKRWWSSVGAGEVIHEIAHVQCDKEPENGRNRPSIHDSFGHAFDLAHFVLCLVLPLMMRFAEPPADVEISQNFCEFASRLTPRLIASDANWSSPFPNEVPKGKVSVTFVAHRVQRGQIRRNARVKLGFRRAAMAHDSVVVRWGVADHLVESDILVKSPTIIGGKSGLVRISEGKSHRCSKKLSSLS